MILSGHQPCYLPGIQLFNKIALSDVFMHCGHLQFKRRSWHSHNFIRTGRLTVPTRSQLGDSVDEVPICYHEPWPRKHLRAIELAYQGYPFFRSYFLHLRRLLRPHYSYLGQLNKVLIEFFLYCLGINTPITVFKGDPKGDALDKLVQMCEQVGADTYLSNLGAMAYLGPEEEARLAKAGITHRWQAYAPPDYGQPYDVNNGRLSILDLLFTHGPKAGQIVRDSGKIA